MEHQEGPTSALQVAKDILRGKNKRIYFSGPVREILYGIPGIRLAEEVQRELQALESAS